MQRYALWSRPAFQGPSCQEMCSKRRKTIDEKKLIIVPYRVEYSVFMVNQRTHCKVDLENDKNVGARIVRGILQTEQKKHERLQIVTMYNGVKFSFNKTIRTKR